MLEKVFMSFHKRINSFSTFDD